jgi:membrane protease YdiL (CAAX protease family)
MLEQIAVTITELAIIVILAYFLKGRFNSYLKKKGVKQQVIGRIKSIMRVELGQPAITIILPAVLAVVLVVFISLATQKPIIGYDLPFWYLLIQTVVVAPIFEEFLFRSALFGPFLIIIAEKASKTKYPLYCLMLLLQAWLFMISHTILTPMPFYSNPFRFADGLLFGALYIVYKRNLVPCIAAHSASNLLVLLTSYF